MTGVIALLGAFAQINPIWQFGPYTASRISYAVQPDWYMGFLDGALRIWPSWSFHSFGYTIPFEVFIPAVLLPGLIFNIAYVWPMIERKFSKDNELHNLLFRPSDRPKHTAVGVATLVFLGMLFIASSTDVIANFFRLPLNEVLWAMRVLVIISPFDRLPGHVEDLQGSTERPRWREAKDRERGHAHRRGRVRGDRRRPSTSTTSTRNSRRRPCLATLSRVTKTRRPTECASRIDRSLLERARRDAQ